MIAYVFETQERDKRDGFGGDNILRSNFLFWKFVQKG